jgi:hypothetical protein
MRKKRRLVQVKPDKTDIHPPVLVDGTLHFQARISHDGHWIIVSKPSNGRLTLHYGDTE